MKSTVLKPCSGMKSWAAGGGGILPRFRNKLDVVEFYAKGRAGEPDILMVDDALVRLEMMSQKEMETTKSRTEKIADIMRNEFPKGLSLRRRQSRMGQRLKTGEIVLIDDLSPDTFRVCEGYDLDEDGNCRVNLQCVTTDYRQTSSFVRCSNCFDFVEVQGEFKRFIEARNILSADPAV